MPEETEARRPAGRPRIHGNRSDKQFAYRQRAKQMRNDQRELALVAVDYLRRVHDLEPRDLPDAAALLRRIIERKS